MRRIVATALLACSLMAGEAPPIISVTVPDLARTEQRLSAGPYGAIWRLPAVQQLRADLGTLPGADPVWLGLIERVQELRATFSVTSHAAGADPRPRLALRLPAGQDPSAPEGTAARRDGDWWLLGDTGDVLAVPAATAGDVAADLRAIVDLPAVADSMRPSDAQSYIAVLGVLGLDRIDVQATAVPEGVRESLFAPGARLPLAVVDTTALAGFPATVVGIAAIGIDGKALVQTVHDLAAAVGRAEALTANEPAMRAKLGLGLDELLLACDGTVVIATTTGSPIPGMTMTLPASPGMDALITALLRDDGVKLVADARSRPVLLPMPRGAPLMVSLRRTATRWIVSSDQMLLQELSQDQPAPFPVATVWPRAAGMSALAWGDTKAQVQMIASLLPMALMQVRDADTRRRIGLAQKALFAALPHLRPSNMLIRQDGRGLRIDGENGLITDVMPVSVMAGMLLPAISLVRQSAQRANAGSNMRQICMGLIAYSTENDGRFPADLAEVQQWSDGELVDKLFQSPGHPEIKHPFLYVRPDPRAKSTQPILVQDPACNRGTGSVVCYADGHIGFVKGIALWVEAQRLAAMPKAAVKEQGIETTDWTVDTETGLPAGAVVPAGDPKAMF